MTEYFSIFSWKKHGKGLCWPLFHKQHLNNSFPLAFLRIGIELSFLTSRQLRNIVYKYRICCAMRLNLSVFLRWQVHCTYPCNLWSESLEAVSDWSETFELSATFYTCFLCSAPLLFSLMVPSNSSRVLWHLQISRADWKLWECGEGGREVKIKAVSRSSNYYFWAQGSCTSCLYLLRHPL